MVNNTRLVHSSVYADNPEKAAKHLSALVDGHVKEFHACEGAWVCFLNDEDWESELIEFYPKSIQLHQDENEIVFKKTQLNNVGVGTHFNLHIHKTRAQLEEIASALKLNYSWRLWANLLDIWLERGILLECKPTKIA